MSAMMEPLVDTLIEDARWAAFGLEDLAQSAILATLAALDLPADGYEISLLGCNDRRIAELNTDFRGKPQPTNVLSWPSNELGAAQDGDLPSRPKPGGAAGPAELGDIAVAWETCEAEALDQAKSMRDHVTHLLVHGTLHLLGYDHTRDGDAALMEGTEGRVLLAMGLADPYVSAR
jgi:probable rRNA maturation factor